MLVPPCPSSSSLSPSILNHPIRSQLDSSSAGSVAPPPWAMQCRKRPCHVGPVPDTSASAIQEALESYVSNTESSALFDLGEYGRLECSNQASIGDILKFGHLLRSLGQLQPTLRFRAAVLSSTLLQMQADSKEKTLNNTSWPHKYWSNFIAQKLMVMMYHLRQLSNRSVKYEQVKRKVSTQERVRLDRLIDDIWGAPAAPSKVRRLVARVSLESDMSLPSVPRDDSEEAADDEHEEGEEAEDAEEQAGSRDTSDAGDGPEPASPVEIPLVEGEESEEEEGDDEHEAH
eukprot:4322947-Lingulodinium_polyedra.AAC.1